MQVVGQPPEEFGPFIAACEVCGPSHLELMHAPIHNAPCDIVTELRVYL